jgi:5-(carboxyamino)imidazole ribonucleotide mutase
MTEQRLAVLLLVGSPGDLDVALRAEETLDELGIRSRLEVTSAHRTPEATVELASSAEAEGFGVIIAFAGLAAHLAGVTAAHSLLPVIGVPIGGGPLQGMDALLSTVQMPGGTPVATVGINGAKNAALLAARILALRDPALLESVRRLQGAEREVYRRDKLESELERRRKERRGGGR